MSETPTPISVLNNRLVKNKAFLLLWAGYFCSGLCISMYSFTQVWYILEELQLKALLGIIFIAEAIPRILLLLVGGVFADRISQSKMMFFSEFLRGILLFLVVLYLLITGNIPFWILLLSSFCFGILDSLFWPAASSITPSLVPKYLLTRAHSILQTTFQSTSVIGPMICGFIITTYSYKGMFSIISIFLILGSLIVLLIKAEAKKEAQTEDHILLSMKKGISYVKREPILKAFIFKTFFLNLFFTGPLAVGIPLFIKNELQGGAVEYSIIEAFLAGGMVIGSIILGMINLVTRRGIVSINAQLFMAVFLILLGLSNHLWQSYMIVFLLGISMIVSNICATTVIQYKTDESLIGRVMSIQTVSSFGMTPVSYGISALCISLHLGVNLIIIGGGICLLVFTFYLLLKIPQLRNV